MENLFWHRSAGLALFDAYKAVVFSRNSEIVTFYVYKLYCEIWIPKESGLFIMSDLNNTVNDERCQGGFDPLCHCFGPIGPQGPIGLRGPTGATGPTGVTGATGEAVLAFGSLRGSSVEVPGAAFTPVPFSVVGPLSNTVTVSLSGNELVVGESGIYQITISINAEATTDPDPNQPYLIFD
jgi:hypothetical protein